MWPWWPPIKKKRVDLVYGHTNILQQELTFFLSTAYNFQDNLNFLIFKQKQYVNDLTSQVQAHRVHTLHDELHVLNMPQMIIFVIKKGKKARHIRLNRQGAYISPHGCDYKSWPIKAQQNMWWDLEQMYSYCK